MITFPNMRLPTSHAHLRDLKLKLPGLVGADGSQVGQLGPQISACALSYRASSCNVWLGAVLCTVLSLSPHAYHMRWVQSRAHKHQR